jgi:hypothetical protein
MMTGEKREQIRARLAEIERANGGRLTPAAVVDDARKQSSPLHDQFEWDKTKAAYAHLIRQARELITSVVVIHRTETRTIKSVFYHRDPNASGNEQGYVSIPTLRSDEDSARAALVDAFSAVGDMLRRARELAVVLEMENEVEALLDSVMELRRRVSEQPAATM